MAPADQQPQQQLETSILLLNFMQRKLLDLLEMAGYYSHDLDKHQTFSHVSHKQWSHKLTQFYKTLKQDELDAGGAQVSKAIELLVLRVQAKSKDPKKMLRDSKVQTTAKELICAEVQADETTAPPLPKKPQTHVKGWMAPTPRIKLKQSISSNFLAKVQSDHVGRRKVSQPCEKISDQIQPYLDHWTSDPNQPSSLPQI